MRERTGSRGRPDRWRKARRRGRPSGPATRMKPRSAVEKTGHQGVECPVENLLQFSAAAQGSIDIENRFQGDDRLDRASGQMFGAQVVELLEDRRIAIESVVQLERIIVEDELVAEDLDATSVAQGDGLVRREPLAVEMRAALALEIDQIRHAVGPMLDPRMMAGNPRVVEKNIEPRDAANIEVGSLQLVDFFGASTANPTRVSGRAHETVA